MIGQGMHGFVENKELRLYKIVDKALREPTDKRIFVISQSPTTKAIRSRSDT